MQSTHTTKITVIRQGIRWDATDDGFTFSDLNEALKNAKELSNMTKVVNSKTIFDLHFSQ